jgi:hypothetical protein
MAPSEKNAIFTQADACGRKENNNIFLFAHGHKARFRAPIAHTKEKGQLGT